jgi:hypothetical protein
LGSIGFPFSRGLVALTRIADDAPIPPKHSRFNITLYLPEQSERESVFTGALPSPDELINSLSVDSVKSMSELTADLQKSPSVVTTVAYASFKNSIGDAKAKELVEAGINIAYSEEVNQVFSLARFGMRSHSPESIR